MSIFNWYDRLPVPEFIKNVIFLVIIIGITIINSYLILGLWPPIVTINSGSMMPNLNNGDIVIVQGASRTNIIPWDEAEKNGYYAFNYPGDVILYRPYGKKMPSSWDKISILFGETMPLDKAYPIICRALTYVQQGEPMWKDGPKAPFSGYITKGDHNDVIDQMAGRIYGMANLSYLKIHRDDIINVGSNISLDKKNGMIIYLTENETFVGEGISYLVPVKNEWIVGKAIVKFPFGFMKTLRDSIERDLQGV